MDVRIATKSDIPALMRIERVEGYERLVGRWDADQHATEIEKSSSKYLLAQDGGNVTGFAILQGLGNSNQCVRLRRIAVQNVGRGVGTNFLESVLKVCFNELTAHRVELLVFEDNERAFRSYVKAGFIEEGVVRDLHRDADGTFRSMRLMSLLRPDWIDRLPGAA